MSEWTMILVMAVCGTLFAIGGTGWKPARRYGIPLFLSVIALLGHDAAWRVLGLVLSLMVVLSAGYGEKTPYWLKALVFTGYGVSFLWIGWDWWVVYTPILCLSIFALSNWKFTTRSFFWKCCEFLFGVFLGITFIAVSR